MSSILSCPACHGEIALPEGRVEAVACPNCASEVRLAALVAEPLDIPPRQVIVTATPRSRPAGTRVARPTPRPSALGSVVGILLGNVLGMVVGYWLLNYLGGPRFNFLQIELPLVPHTQVAKPAPEPPPAAPLVPRGPILEEEEPPPRPAIVPPAETPVAYAPGSPTGVAPVAILFPKYSADDLGQALAAAHAAAGCEHCKSTGYVMHANRRQPCEVCGGKPSGRINAGVYATFCRLSEVLTFIDLDRGDTNLAERKAAVERVFLLAASDQERQDALGRLASHHLNNRDRAQPGVLLAGTVQELGQTGDYYWARLLLFGLGEKATVVYRTPARLKPRDRVLIAGSVIDSPRQRLPGYSGAESQVVWGGLPLSLPAAPR